MRQRLGPCRTSSNVSFLTINSVAHSGLMPWPRQGRPLADHDHHDHHLDDLTAGIQCPAPECALQPQGVEWLADAGFAGVVVVSPGLCQAERVVLSHPGSLSLRGLGKDLLQVGRSVSLPGGQQVASKPPAHHLLCAPVCLAAGLHPPERLRGWALPDHSEGHHPPGLSGRGESPRWEAGPEDSGSCSA